jgi:DNA-binding NtrC family response regulator
MEGPANHFLSFGKNSVPGRAAPANATILVVEDEAIVRRGLAERLWREGCHVLDASTIGTAVDQLGDTIDVMLLDRGLPDGDGLALLQKARTEYPDIPVVMMSASVTLEQAVTMVKRGAFHYVSKGDDLDDLVLHVRKALEAVRLRRQVHLFQTQPGTSGRGLDTIVGDSPAIRHVKSLLAQVAASHAATVLLTGETGTGKALVAQALHDASERAARAFVQITCSTLPEQLLESELFGHERGAFTDARQQKRGLLEAADGGTVFLDEIGEMTLPLQAKLLRFLEDQTFRRIGGRQDIRVDVRIIAATHRNLPQDVRDGRFREDLYCRLNVMPIDVPPLRERREDIWPLTNHFIDRYNRDLRKRVRGISPDARGVLERHDWPGNVRELRNAIERGMLLIDGDWIEPADLALPFEPHEQPQFQLPRDGVKLDDVARELLLQALTRARGNQARAGELLGISRDQVRYRLRKFGIGSRRAVTQERSPSPDCRREPSDESRKQALQPGTG